MANNETRIKVKEQSDVSSVKILDVNVSWVLCAASYYHPPRSAEGNVFTHVCLSVC